MKNNKSYLMQQLNSVFPLFSILIYIFAFAVYSFCFLAGGLIGGKEIYNGITIIFGWFVTIGILMANLDWTKRNNSQLKKEEIKKSLEREAFKEVNKAVTNLSKGINGLGGGVLSLHWIYKMSKAGSTDFKIEDAAMKIQNDLSELERLESEFMLAVEANEIAVLKFNHYHKYFQMFLADSFKDIEAIKNKLLIFKIDNTESNEVLKYLETEGISLGYKYRDLLGFLHDYRRELMNHFQSEIFGEEIPERNPVFSNRKTLQKAAEKETVLKEWDEREKKAAGII